MLKVLVPTASSIFLVFFFQAEDGIRDVAVTGVQTCALPILHRRGWRADHSPVCHRPCAGRALDTDARQSASRPWPPYSFFVLALPSSGRSPKGLLSCSGQSLLAANPDRSARRSCLATHFPVSSLS